MTKKLTSKMLLEQAMQGMSVPKKRQLAFALQVLKIEQMGEFHKALAEYIEEMTPAYAQAGNWRELCAFWNLWGDWKLTLNHKKIAARLGDSGQELVDEYWKQLEAWRQWIKDGGGRVPE